MTSDRPGKPAHVDYDIQGVVGVRLVDAGARAVSAVENQLGPAGAALNREPDIEVHFVAEIPTPRLIFLGLDAAGFDEQGFYVLRSSKARCKARIPFEDIGQRKIVIQCEHDLRSVPLLIALVNLSFLSKGLLPLHASTFLFENKVSLITGWAKGGKTEALLSFAQNGAAYIADEWTIIDQRNDRVFGIAEPIRLWDWQLDHVPELKRKLSRQKKVLFTGIHAMNAVGRMLRQSPLRRTYPARLFNEALPAFNRQLNVRLHPRDIFDNRLCDSGSVDAVFLIMSHDSPEITITACEPAEVAERMISSNQAELMPFWEYYYAFTFAFPDRKNPFLERIRDTQYGLLESAFLGREAYRVMHPYPVDFRALFDAMRPYCSGRNGG